MNLGMYFMCQNHLPLAEPLNQVRLGMTQSVHHTFKLSDAHDDCNRHCVCVVIPV